jgi:hypothetical protein
MKLAYFLLLPFMFSCCVTVALRADDDEKVEIKEKNKDGKHEFKMKVKKKGDKYVGFYDNREYTLRGDAVTRLNTEGDYIVYGDMSPDNTYIETREFRPVTVRERVEERSVPVRDKEVIIEKK